MSKRRKRGKLNKLSEQARLDREDRWTRKKDRAARIWANRHVKERVGKQ